MRIVTTVLALAVLAGACHSRVETDPSTGRVDVDARVDKKPGEEWTSDVSGMGAWAAAKGRATGREAAGTLTVTLNVQDFAPSAQHPWHVHEGKCGSGGPVVGPASAYPPLRIQSDGRGSATASVQVSLNEARDYHINVHRSASEMGTIIACGDFDD